MAYLLAGQHIQILENNTDCNVGLVYNYNYDMFTSKSDRNKLNSSTSRSDSAFAEKFPFYFFFFLIPFLRFVSGSTETLASLTLKKNPINQKAVAFAFETGKGLHFLRIVRLYHLADSSQFKPVLVSITSWTMAHKTSSNF